MALRRNVLIFHQAALGDFIITWPLALALGRTFPQSRVIYVTASQKGKLAEQALGVEWADSEGGWHALFAADAQPPPAPLKMLADAHTILSFVSNGDDVWAANVRRLAPEAPLIPLQTSLRPGAPLWAFASAAKPRVPPLLQGHITSELFMQLKPWPVIQTAMGQMLSSVCDRGIGYRCTASTAQQGIIIHPGGGKPEKCWPVEKFIALIERLKVDAVGAGRIAVLLGEVELERWPASQVEALRSAAEVRALHSLDDLLKNIAPAKAFIGNDSGPGHLAGIIGVPTISLFGQDPNRWHPLGPRVRSMQSSSLAAGVAGIEMADVFQAVLETLHQ